MGNIAISPSGELWGAVWPERGQIVRFDSFGTPQEMLTLDSQVDFLAFGQPGTELAGLLFVSNNDGDLVLVDLVSLEMTPIGINGTRGDIVKTTPDGRVLLSQSEQIDVLNPVRRPQVVYTNPPSEGTIALPQGPILVTFDQDLDRASALDPDNYQLRGEATGILRPEEVTYDVQNRTVSLDFGALGSDNYELIVEEDITSTAGFTLGTDYLVTFTALANFLAQVDLEFSNPRYHRGDGTLSYDVILTNKTDYDLRIPLQLLLEQGEETYLIDLSEEIPDGILSPLSSVSSASLRFIKTLTFANPEGKRLDFQPSIFTLPYINAAPVFTSEPVTSAKVGETYNYQAIAVDPDGITVNYLLYSGPEGLTVDSATGLITWQPTPVSPVREDITFIAYDSRGGRTLQSFTIEVEGGNKAPIFAPLPPEIQGREGELLQLSLNITDPERDFLQVGVQNLPPGASFDPTTQIFTWIPGFNAAGIYEDITFRADDGINTVTTSIKITITPVNQPPSLAPIPDRIV